jgi:hypothetical protein
VDESGWYAEIDRRGRQRLPGFYLCAGFFVLMLVGYANSTRMMHGPGYTAAEGTIVALGTGSGGEPTMTSEIRDAAGVVHRDTQPTSYHYARGEPRVGESIGYLYRASPYTGEFVAVVRADGLLKWLFGPAAAVMGLFGLGSLAFILRQARQRRALVREGERVKIELPRIGHRSMALPAGAAGTVRIDLWRLEGRVFDPQQGEYVECASDWQQPPAPEPGFDPALVPPLLVDRAKPSRRWLPVGALWRRR